MVGLLAIVGLVAATQATTGPPGRAAQAEQLMLALVNEVRDEHALAHLTPRTDLAEVAHGWSVAMARTGVLEHNPDHPEQICCWTAVSENVAFADPSPWRLRGDPVERVTRELHQALLDSPPHRANLLDATVDEVGIGIEVGPDGRVWITQNFRRHDGS